MICVRCTKNNAPAGVYICPYCKDRPYFNKGQKVAQSVVDKFEALPRKKQNEILLLIHQRLMSLIKIARLQDFNLNELMTDYVVIATCESQDIRDDIAMKPTDFERGSYFERSDFFQYVSPKREYQP
jgi:hypothetical protein